MSEGSRHRHRGEDNPAARLTEDTVRQIRLLRANGWIYEDLAEEFGVATSTVCSAANGWTWAHVKAELPPRFPRREIEKRREMNQTKTTREDLAASAAQVWIRGGPCAVTYSAVQDAADISRGGVSMHFPTSKQMRRAAARYLVLTDVGMAGRRLQDLNEGSKREFLAYAEARAWLGRHGWDDE